MVEMFFILDHKCHCWCAIWNHKSRLTPWTKRKGLYFNSEMFVIKDFKYIIHLWNQKYLLVESKTVFNMQVLNSFFSLSDPYLICKKKCIGFFFIRLQFPWIAAAMTSFFPHAQLPRSPLNCSSFILTEIMEKHNYKLYIIVKEITLLKLSMYLPHQTLYVLCTIIRHILFRIYTYIVVRPWVFDKIQIF